MRAELAKTTDEREFSAPPKLRFIERIIDRDSPGPEDEAPKSHEIERGVRFKPTIQTYLTYARENLFVVPSIADNSLRGRIKTDDGSTVRVHNEMIQTSGRMYLVPKNVRA
jgi:hypothetical protein